MANTIGGRIVLEGASTYNSDLKAIKSNMAELRSEMKLANSTYSDMQNTTEALSAKNEILTKQVEQAAKKVDVYSKAVKDASTDQEAAAKKVDTYSKELEEAEKALEEMKTSGTATNEELRAQQDVINDLNTKLSAAEKQYDNASLKVNQYSTAQNNAQVELNKLNSELQENEQYLNEAKNSSDGCAKSIDKFGKSAKDAEDEINELDQSTEDAVKTMAELLVASGIAERVEDIKDAILACADAVDVFELSMAKVNTLAGYGKSELAEMGNEIRQVAVETGTSATAIADAVYQSMSAGVSASEAVGFAANAAKLSIGGFTDAATAVDVVTTALNAYGLSADEAEHVMDNLVTTQNLGKTTVAELAASMGRVIPTASAYDVSLDNISAAYAEMTAKGTNTQITTTYLAAMLAELGDSSKDVAVALEKETGKSFGTLMREGKSLGDVLSSLMKVANNDKEAFMGLWSSSTAANAAFAMASDGGARFNEILDAMQSNSGAMEEAFDTMYDAGTRLDDLVSAATENFKIAVGGAIDPILDDLAEKELDVLEPLTEFVEDNPELVSAIAGLATAIAGTATALGIATVAAAAWNAVLAANPYTLTVLAITGAVGALAGLASAYEDTTTTIGKASKAASDHVTSMNDMAEAQANDIAKAEALASKIKELNSQEDLSTQEQMSLNAAVEAFNELVPNSTLAIDENTGRLQENTDALGENTDALQDSIDALIEQYKVAAYQEEISEICKQLAEDELALDEANEELSKSQQQLEGDWTGAYDLYLVAADGVETQQAAVDNLTESIEAQRTRLEELTGYVDEYSASTEESSAAVRENAETVTTSQEEIIQAYNEAHQSALSSIQSQIGLFDDLASSSNETAATLSANLQTQADNLELYAANVDAAMELMTSSDADTQAFFQAIIDEGLSGADALNQFVKAAQDGAPEFQAAVEAYAKSAELQADIADKMAELETGYRVGYEEITDTVDEKEEILAEKLAMKNEERLQTQEEHKDDLVNVTVETVTGIADAVDATSPQLVTSITDMSEATITAAQAAIGYDAENGRSTVFYDLGTTIDNSLAQGIQDSSSAVSQAIKKVCEDAVASLDVSGVVEKIDAALGAQID